MSEVSFPLRLRTARGDIAVLLLLAGLMFVSGLGLRDPWPADEPRFALVAKEMVETGIPE